MGRCSTRNHLYGKPPYFLTQETANDFSTAAYVISRHHAAKLVKLHCRGDKYKLDNGVNPAVADDLIYNSGNTFSVPVLLYKIALGSSIHPDHIDIFHRSSHDGLLNWWQQNGANVQLDVLMNCDPYYGRVSEPEKQQS